MTQHKVVADDSLSAMDEISKVLGKEAVILKTQKVNGKIEILVKLLLILRLLKHLQTRWRIC